MQTAFVPLSLVMIAFVLLSTLGSLSNVESSWGLPPAFSSAAALTRLIAGEHSHKRAIASTKCAVRTSVRRMRPSLLYARAIETHSTDADSHVISLMVDLESQRHAQLHKGTFLCSWQGTRLFCPT